MFFFNVRIAWDKAIFIVNLISIWESLVTDDIWEDNQNFAFKQLILKYNIDLDEERAEWLELGWSMRDDRIIKYHFDIELEKYKRI